VEAAAGLVGLVGLHQQAILVVRVAPALHLQSLVLQLQEQAVVAVAAVLLEEQPVAVVVVVVAVLALLELLDQLILEEAEEAHAAAWLTQAQAVLVL
jgi:hypothetical protein